MLRDANQEIPEWLEKIASQSMYDRGGRGRGRGGRGGGGRYGGGGYGGGGGGGFDRRYAFKLYSLLVLHLNIWYHRHILPYSYL